MRTATMSTMTDNIQTVLSPLFITSYVTATRLVKFSASESKLWMNHLHMLIFWSIYYFLFVFTITSYIYTHSITYQLNFWLNMSTALLSVVLGMYYNKKFRRCLSKLDIVDDTFGKLGITTDYQKLYMIILLAVFGLTIYLSLITYINATWFKSKFKLNTIISVYTAVIIKYPSYVNLIDDMIITSTLGYIALKFDQINQYLRKIESNNEFAVKSAWKHTTLLPRQIEYQESKSREWVTWVVIHLHLELRKISRELNSIFELQMILKMGSYFAFIAISCCRLFEIFLTHKYVDRSTANITLIVMFIFINTFRLFIINYICENISIKANTVGDEICRIPYTTHDVAIRENISQLVLQINLIPLKFHGLGLFQFGLKFFHGFTSSVTTVIVISLQASKET